MTAQNILQWVDTAMDEILANPQGWGGIDALEPLFLLLVILRGEVASPRIAQQQVLTQYWTFLATHIRPGSDDLRARLGQDLSVETMVAVLRKYAALVRQVPVTPASPRRTFPRFLALDHQVSHG